MIKFNKPNRSTLTLILLLILSGTGNLGQWVAAPAVESTIAGVAGTDAETVRQVVDCGRAVAGAAEGAEATDEADVTGALVGAGIEVGRALLERAGEH